MILDSLGEGGGLDGPSLLFPAMFICLESSVPPSGTCDETEV